MGVTEARLGVSRAQLLDAIDNPNRRAELPASALTEAFLARIEAWQPVVNAFVTVTPELARAQASAADDARRAGRSLGVLHGVAVVVKDDIEVAGVRCTVGSSFLRDYVAKADAAVVQGLKAAGAVLVGKAGLNEWAYGITCDNVHFGAIRNPWDTTRIPGGSSGGSGVALGADLCVGALGSDAGGSVRIPAAFNGVSGLRPTLGSVSADATYPIAPSIETIGPMARSVGDVARILSAIGAAHRDGTPLPLDDLIKGREQLVRGLRVGLPRSFFFDGVDVEIVGAVRAAADELERLGAEIWDADLASPEEVVPAAKLLIRADAYAIHEERVTARPEGYGEEVRDRLLLGREVTGAQLARAYETCRAWTRELDRVFREVDLVLTPTTERPARPIEGADMTAETEAITRHAIPFSVAGVPALSVPCGFTSGGLPIGAQLAAPRWRDNLVLRVGAAYQQVTDWHRRRPPEPT